MTVLIDIRTEGFPEELEAVMEKIALDSLKYEGFQEECEISISIVDNEEIHQINKQFRGIDRPTDVLSFPQLTFEEGEIMDRNENGEVVLGDIIISLERGKRTGGGIRPFSETGNCLPHCPQHAPSAGL